ncbi:hypothetical protein D7L76_RS07160 [Enterococcus hirae]
MELDKFRDVDLVIDHVNDIFFQNQFVSQNDNNGRSLTVQVTNNGVIGEVPGLVLNLRWHNRSSSLTDLSPFELIDKEHSIFQIYYPKNMLNPGRVVANIQVIQDGHVSHLKPFDITVQQLMGEAKGIISKSEYGALVEVLADANKFRTDIDTLDKNKVDQVKLEESKKEIAQNISELDNNLSIMNNQKVDKGGASQVTWGMLAQDARQQISGNKVAVVGVNGVTTENYTDSSVTALKLERPLQESLIEFSKQELNVSLGNFSTYDKTYHVVDNYYSIKSQVAPNELYSCDTVVKGEYSAIVHFFSDSNCSKYLSSLGIGNEGVFTDFRFSTPAKAQSIIISSYKEKPVLKVGMVLSIQSVAEQLKYTKKLETEILEGFYSSLDNSFYPNAKYKTAKYISPKAGETLLFTCNSNTKTVGACICWKNENERISIISGEVREYVQQEIVVPEGTSFITVTSIENMNPLIEIKETVDVQELSDNVKYLKEKQEALKLPQDTLNVRVMDDTLEILSKYATNKDLKRTLKRMSANNTVQLGNFYLIKNTDETVGNDFGDDSDVLYSQYTDMLGPWGGLNTKKSDGSGREILKETVYYEFTQDCINVTVEAEALEDITIEEYYFLQFQRTVLFREPFLVVGDPINSKRISEYDINIYGSNTPESQVTQMIFNGNDDVAELNYDPTYGIGKLYYNVGSPSWHYRSYGKAYFDLISRKKVPLRLEKGEILHCRGGYKFYRKVEN